MLGAGWGRGRGQRTSVLTPENCLLKDFTDVSVGIGQPVLRGFAHSSQALTDGRNAPRLALGPSQLLSAEGVYREGAASSPEPAAASRGVNTLTDRGKC